MGEPGVEEGRIGLSNAEIGPFFLKNIGEGQLGRYVLLPGDPARVATMASQWDEAHTSEAERGFAMAHGSYHGVQIAALSTGIGGPSMERVLTEAAMLGADTFIRVGTTGALQESIKNGDLVINEASVRLDGTSRMLVREEFPAAASYEVTLALVEACETFSFPFHVGVGATTASFYGGQGRRSYGGYWQSSMASLIEDLTEAKVLNFEMECAALLTLCRLFALRGGAVCSVIAHRITGDWADNGGIERACLAGAEAVRILTGWDKAKTRSDKHYFCPRLLANSGV